MNTLFLPPHSLPSLTLRESKFLRIVKYRKIPQSPNAFSTRPPHFIPCSSPPSTRPRAATRLGYSEQPPQLRPRLDLPGPTRPYFTGSQRMQVPHQDLSERWYT